MKLYFLFLLFSVLTLSQNSNSIFKSKLETFLNSSFLDTTLIAVDIYDLTQQKIVFQKNNKMLLHPASNMKILTSAAGLLFLGKDYEFETSLYYNGKISNSTLNGDLFIVGGCDPDFSLKDLDSLVSSMLNFGIKKINGNIYADISMMDSVNWGNGWMWNDDPSTDAPYLSPLNINDNAITVSVYPNNQNQIAYVKVEPESNFYRLYNFTTTTFDTTDLFITRDFINHSNDIYVKGFISQYSSGYSERINIINPHLFFLTLFVEKLKHLGIEFYGDFDTLCLKDNSQFLFSIKRKFSDVIVNLNKTSDNLSAEMTLLAIAKKYFGEPATAKNGLMMIDTLIYYCGYNPDNYRLVDGSGVSHYNLISAELLLGVLRYFYFVHTELQKILEESFPTAGIDGTLKNRMNGSLAENNVHAKTGTLSGVSCLSGYLNSLYENKIAFSIMIQNHVNNYKRVIEIQNTICNLIAEFY